MGMIVNFGKQIRRGKVRDGDIGLIGTKQRPVYALARSRDVEVRGLGSGGRPLFLGLAVHGAGEGLTGIGETRRSGDDAGGRMRRIGSGVGGRIDKRLKQVGGGQEWFLDGVVVVEHPAGQHGFGRFLDPLVDQGADFAAQVGCMI